jgi:hypothetical protein
VSENRKLKRMLGPKRMEGVGGWKRMHNGELHNLYGSADIMKLMN